MRSRSVAEVEELVSPNASVQRVAGRAKYAAPAFYIFMGAIFTGFGLLSSKDMKSIVLLGVGFLVFGVYVLAANIRAFGKNAPLRCLTARSSAAVIDKVSNPMLQRAARSAQGFGWMNEKRGNQRRGGNPSHDVAPK